MSNSRLKLTVKMLMQLTSNIIKTAGLNMSQMYFVNTRKHQTRASEVAAKIEFVTMAEMALKSVKIGICRNYRLHTTPSCRKIM